MVKLLDLLLRRLVQVNQPNNERVTVTIIFSMFLAFSLSGLIGFFSIYSRRHKR